jgi:hypothetical protein
MSEEDLERSSGRDENEGQPDRKTEEEEETLEEREGREEEVKWSTIHGSDNEEEEERVRPSKPLKVKCVRENEEFMHSLLEIKRAMEGTSFTSAAAKENAFQQVLLISLVFGP